MSHPDHHRRADAIANAARVIEAAQEVFAEKGFAVEMKEIAERAGVGIGTIYRNFPTKGDLALAIVTDAVEDLATHLADAEALPDPMDGLRDALTHMYHMSDRLGWLMEAVMIGQGPIIALKEHMEDIAKDPRFQASHRMLQRAIDAGTLRTDLDIELTIAMLTGTRSPHVQQIVRDHRSPEEAAAAVIDLMLLGMSPRQDRPVITCTTSGQTADRNS